MPEALQTFLVLGCVALAVFIICEVLSLIHAYRLRVNREAIADANGRCAKLSEENAWLWSQVTANAPQMYVNSLTISRLMSENDMLEKENKDLKDKTPVKEPIRVKRFRH